MPAEYLHEPKPNKRPMTNQAHTKTTAERSPGASQLGTVRHAQAAAVTTTTALAAALVAFVINILMARQLGPASRGQVAWALQFAYVAAPVVALGVDRQALRGNTSRPTQAHIWLICSTVCVLAALTRSLPLGVSATAAAIGASVAVERALGMANGSLRRFIVLQLAIQVWNLVAALTLYITGIADVHYWLAIYAAPAPILAFLAFSSSRACKRTTASSPVRPSMTSIQYMIGGVGTLLAARVERLLLPALASTRQLGLYVSIATASEFISWGARGLGDSRVAILRQNEPTRRQLLHNTARSVTAFTAIAIPLGFAIRYLLIPTLGSEFAATKPLVIPLTIASLAWSTYLQVSSAWLACGSAAESLTIDVCTATLTAVIVLLLVPAMGALGAAYACLIAYTVMTLVAIVLFPPKQTRQT